MRGLIEKLKSMLVLPVPNAVAACEWGCRVAACDAERMRACPHRIRVAHALDNGLPLDEPAAVTPPVQ